MTRLETILEDLATLPGWEERYEYVIDLGKQLPAFPPQDMVEENLVRGCTSTVYMTIAWRVGAGAKPRLDLKLTSDALIVNGLLGIVMAAYDGQPAELAKAIDLPALLASSNLLEHLSPNRRHGFASVVERIRAFVQA